MRTLVVLVHRARWGGVHSVGVLLRPRTGSVAGLREGVRHTAQLLGGEVQGLYVRTRCLQLAQRRQVDPRPCPGLRLLVVVFGAGGQGREQLLGRRRLLVGDDVVRPALHGGGGAQLLPHHRTDEDSTVVLERDAGDLLLPRVLAQDPGFGSHHQPPLPFVEVWEQHLELHSELTANLAGDAHTTTTSRTAGSNTLILCEPLPPTT
ncbi:MAG TPA: hypothetical protein VN520_11465 [Streptomyces sp.]|uniref:hypothetical protein n=1 Tax=Streptomyces sp. TaxID=1931 RepID=UPI002CCDF61F|nr:hypothetical protein [Streptomyces sp.]HWU06983.1 hypothetical protein [Streptomyces sp.]